MLAIKKDKGPPRTRRRIHKLPGLYATCLLGGSTFGCFSDKFRNLFGWLLSRVYPLHTQSTQGPVEGRRLQLSCAWRPPLARRVEA
jgi:hypothetical protein